MEQNDIALHAEGGLFATPSSCDTDSHQSAVSQSFWIQKKKKHIMQKQRNYASSRKWQNVPLSRVFLCIFITIFLFKSLFSSPFTVSQICLRGNMHAFLIKLSFTVPWLAVRPCQSSCLSLLYRMHSACQNYINLHGEQIFGFIL